MVPVTGRELLIAVGLSAALVGLVFLSPPGFHDSLDYLRFHEPLHAFSKDALSQGRLPLWNPHVNLGRPHLADIQSGIFYPTGILDLIAPVAVAFYLVAVLHVALGAAGFALLAQALGVKRRLAWLFGFVFFLSGSVASTLQTGSIECVQAVAYLPFVFLLAIRLQDRRTLGALAALALVLALQLLCGHPQYSWLTGLGAGLFLLGRRMQAPWRANVRGLAVDGALLLAAALWALVIAAVQILPFWELVSQGNRSERSLAFANSWSMPWIDWATLGRPVKQSFRVNWVDNLYLGALLPLAGAAASTRLGDRNVRALLLTSVVGVLLAAGDRTPIFALMYEILPGVSSFRLHARSALLPVLALAIGAGLFLSEAPSMARRATLALGGGALLAWLGILAVELRLPAGDRDWFEAAGQAALVGLTAVLLACWPRRQAGNRARWLAGALVIVGAVDLTRATLAMKHLYAGGPARFPAEEAAAGELKRLGLIAPEHPPPRVSMPYPVARENAGMLHGYSTFTGYVSLSLDRVWRYLHGSLGLDPPAILNTIPSNDIYKAGPFPYRSMNLSLGFDLRSRLLLREKEPDPRAYLVSGVAVVPSWREGIRRMSQGHDFHRVALVERPIEGLPSSEMGSSSSCSARIESFAPERLRVTTSCPHPALLILAEPWYPGWEAEVGGRRMSTLPANVWMRSVPVPAGRHQVVFTFRSTHLPLGAVLSTLGLAGVAVVGFSRLRRRRGGRPGPVS